MVLFSMGVWESFKYGLFISLYICRRIAYTSLAHHGKEDAAISMAITSQLFASCIVIEKRYP